MEKELTGKTAIVTGGGSGIGAATAELFAKHGANVIVSDINDKGAKEVVQKINAGGGTAFFIQADVGKAADCERLVTDAVKKYGALDIAFNNAGIGGEINPVDQMSLEGWQRVININLDSIFYCMKYQLAAMLKNGKGAIVNMSSILGQVGFAHSAAYVAAKHGVVGITKTAAIEYSAKGIRINAVGPGFIKTPLLSALDEDTLGMLVKLHPIGRLGEAGEVAELVLWLSSDKASFVTGSYYAVDGGYLSM